MIHANFHYVRGLIAGILLTLSPISTVAQIYTEDNPAQIYTAESPEEAVKLARVLYTIGKICYQFERYICALDLLESISMLSRDFDEIDAEIDAYEWTIITAKTNAFVAYSESERLTLNDKLVVAMRAQGLYELLVSKYQGERMMVLGHAIYLAKDPCGYHSLRANEKLKEIEQAGFQNEQQVRLFAYIQKLPNYKPNCE